MPDAPAPAKGQFGVLAHKAGPLPVGVWLVIGVGVWWFVARGGGGGGGGTAPAADAGVDPMTGAPWSQEYAAASVKLSEQQQSGTIPGPKTYANNTDWSRSAINYLVSLGIDPSQANQAITVYLSSQALTSQQQADINLAITGVGAPPDLPGPGSTNPGQIVTPPTVTPPKPVVTPPPQVTRYAAPAGLKVTGTTPSTVSVQWTIGTPKPASYTVATYQANGVRVGYSTVSVPDATKGNETTTITGLHSKWSYKVNVWANGGKQAPPHATVVATTK